MEKFKVKLKHLCEDFIVEERAKDWNCEADWSSPQEISIPEKPDDSNYLCFELIKRDIDHFVAIKTLAKELQTSLKSLGFAGAKDRKAITSQRISLFEPNLDLVKNFKSDFIKLKNFKWEKRKIKIGYLEGNKFRITLRAIKSEDAEKVLETIKKNKSFPNFFGPQRFGSVRGNNATVGKLILKKDFEGVIMNILTDDSVDEKPDILEARRKLKKDLDFKVIKLIHKLRT